MRDSSYLPHVDVRCLNLSPSQTGHRSEDFAEAAQSNGIYSVRNNLLHVRFFALLRRRQSSTLPDMKRRFLTSISLTFLFAASQLLSAQPTPTAVSAFNAYSQAVESRLAQQHSSSATFLSASSDPRLRSGELLIEQLTPTSADLPGALLHHWRGSAFTPGATADDFERLLRDVNAYPEHFAPQVVQAKVVSMSGGNMQATMRTRQHHVLTVVIDATYDVAFGELDAHERYSNSRSTRILEIDSPGTAAERPLHASEEHGLPLEAQHPCVELRGARWRTLSPDRSRFVDSLDPARTRLGDPPLRRNYSARIAGVHASCRMQRAPQEQFTNNFTRRMQR